jgi:hypothetical protein
MTTMTKYGPQDFSIDIEDAPGTRGRLIVIGGRALLMRGVPHEIGYEIDALDGPVLMHELVVALLDQAFPRGPGALRGVVPIKIVQKSRAIRIATASASGRLEAPWSLTGTARRDGARIEYELVFAFTASDATKSMRVAGVWEKAADVLALDDHMPLDGWTVHWLGPMSSESDQGTTLDYGANPDSKHWVNLSALRKYIADGVK